MRTQRPFSSFIGYFSRRSPETSSRTEAPFAQCEPRLMGLSQLGSWPIHTPFETSAVTVQPTEQCVQILLRMVTCAPAAAGGPASAFCTLRRGIAPSVARPPATTPERRRKVRRSRPPLDWPASAAESLPRRASRSVRLISTAASLLRVGVAIDAVEFLDVIGFPITGFPLFLVVFAIGFRRRCERGDGCDTGARTDRSQKITAACRYFRFLFHRRSPQVALVSFPRPSVSERKSFRFDFHEGAPETPDC